MTKKGQFTHWAMIDLLFTIDHGFFIKPRSSLIDRIYKMRLVFFHCPKKNQKIDHRKMKRLIIYDRKSMIGLKNWFLKTDQSIMIENQFLIGITAYQFTLDFVIIFCVPYISHVLIWISVSETFFSFKN